MIKIFRCIEPELNNLIALGDKIDSFHSLYMLVKMSHHVWTAQNVDPASFLSTTLGNVLVTVKRNFDKCIVSWVFFFPNNLELLTIVKYLWVCMCVCVCARMCVYIYLKDFQLSTRGSTVHIPQALKQVLAAIYRSRVSWMVLCQVVSHLHCESWQVLE